MQKVMVASTLANHEVGVAIVPATFIDMMNYGTDGEGLAKRPFSDQYMLSYVSSGICPKMIALHNQPITVAQRNPALPISVVLAPGGGRARVGRAVLERLVDLTNPW